VVGSVRDIASRLSPSVQPELAKEIGDLRTRLAQLESLAQSTFPAEFPKPVHTRRTTAPTARPPVKTPIRKQNRRRRTA
jgi:hypothetical protein